MPPLHHRGLSRNSAHRRSLLRNLVTNLIFHESIRTTLAKARETQRLAEKLISLGKRNTQAARDRAKTIFHNPEREGRMDKLFGELRQRYEGRPGGYTRVLRCESFKDDAAESAVVSLVDGPRDMRFSMTAKALVRQREQNLEMTEALMANVRKVTRFRADGESALEEEVRRLEKTDKGRDERKKKPEEDGAGYGGNGGYGRGPRNIRGTERWASGKLERRPEVVDTAVPG
jgi:large subunit ribosomal protein L17